MPVDGFPRRQVEHFDAELKLPNNAVSHDQAHLAEVPRVPTAVDRTSTTAECTAVAPVLLRIDRHGSVENKKVSQTNEQFNSLKHPIARPAWLNHVANSVMEYLRRTDRVSGRQFEQRTRIALHILPFAIDYLRPYLSTCPK